MDSERDFEDSLVGIFTAFQDLDLDDLEEVEGALCGAEIPAVSGVSTFQEAGVLTRNKGLVVRLQNGAEFQITIVQSALAEEE